MFHDYKPLPLDLPTKEEQEEEAKKKRDEIRDNSLTGLPGVDVDTEGQWKRIERVIHSPFWRAMHNLFAHPLLAIYRPWGERLHEYTATRMYAGDGPGIVTNND